MMISSVVTPQDVYNRQTITWILIIVLFLINSGVLVIQILKYNMHKSMNRRLDLFLKGQGETNQAVLRHLITSDAANKTLVGNVANETRKTLEKVETVVAQGITNAADVLALQHGSADSSNKLKTVPPVL